MHERLRQFVASSERRARALPGAEVLAARVRDLPPAAVLERAPFGVIAEVKFKAPSQASAFAEPNVDDAVARAKNYALGGAAAISVLTEPDHFHGSMHHLAAVSDAVAVPVMRKDFLVSPAQVFEARLHGASGVLVVLRCAPDPRALINAAAEAGLFVLVEAFDASDVALLEGLGPFGDHVLAGVNARDLDTLGIDAGRFAGLRSSLPAGVPAVAESGMGCADDARRAAQLGYQMVLVGSALMAHADPTGLVRSMREAGLAAVRT